MLKIAKKRGHWQHFWGCGPLPKGATAICVVESDNDIGALLKLANGSYVQGNCGCIKSLNQDKVKSLLVNR